MANRKLGDRGTVGAAAGFSSVTVHHYRVWDAARGYFIVAPLKGTEARIKRLSGKIIPGTTEEVDPARIDEQGRCRPPEP